jgi:hypothetical protein
MVSVLCRGFLIFLLLGFININYPPILGPQLDDVAAGSGEYVLIRSGQLTSMVVSTWSRIIVLCRYV